jgi:hypothetical protein
MAPDRVEDLGLELTKVRRLDPDPGPALKAHENEKKDMNCAQPSTEVFVRGKCWLAGWAAPSRGGCCSCQPWPMVTYVPMPDSRRAIVMEE